MSDSTGIRKEGFWDTAKSVWDSTAGVVGDIAGGAARAIASPVQAAWAAITDDSKQQLARQQKLGDDFIADRAKALGKKWVYDDAEKTTGRWVTDPNSPVDRTKAERLYDNYRRKARAIDNKLDANTDRWASATDNTARLYHLANGAATAVGLDGATNWIGRNAAGLITGNTLTADQYRDKLISGTNVSPEQQRLLHMTGMALSTAASLGAGGIGLGRAGASAAKLLAPKLPKLRMLSPAVIQRSIAASRVGNAMQTAANSANWALRTAGKAGKGLIKAIASAPRFVTQQAVQGGIYGATSVAQSMTNRYLPQPVAQALRPIFGAAKMITLKGGAGQAKTMANNTDVWTGGVPKALAESAKTLWNNIKNQTGILGKGGQLAAAAFAPVPFTLRGALGYGNIPHMMHSAAQNRLNMGGTAASWDVQRDAIAKDVKSKITGSQEYKDAQKELADARSAIMDKGYNVTMQDIQRAWDASGKLQLLDAGISDRIADAASYAAPQFIRKHLTQKATRQGGLLTTGLVAQDLRDSAAGIAQLPIYRIPYVGKALYYTGFLPGQAQDKIPVLNNINRGMTYLSPHGKLQRAAMDGDEEEYSRLYDAQLGKQLSYAATDPNLLDKSMRQRLRAPVATTVGQTLWQNATGDSGTMPQDSSGHRQFMTAILKDMNEQQRTAFVNAVAQSTGQLSPKQLLNLAVATKRHEQSGGKAILPQQVTQQLRNKFTSQFADAMYAYVRQGNWDQLRSVGGEAISHWIKGTI